MRAVTWQRIVTLLLWIVIAGIWFAFYPAFRLTKSEVIVALLALFFFLGVQKFREDQVTLKKCVEHGVPLPVSMTAVARWWRKWRAPAFLCGGLACIAWFAVSVIRRS